MACPVKHLTSASGGCPVSGKQQEGCGGSDEPSTFSAFKMGANRELPPNQLPSAGQTMPLSTHRMASRIPRTTAAAAAGGDASTGTGTDTGTAHPEETWLYPSEQQFYNAMKRKGYAPQEEEMDAVVQIHNAVNERAWSEVVAWESTLHPECEDLKLVRFMGKPNDPTPIDSDWRERRGYYGYLTAKYLGLQELSDRDASIERHRLTTPHTEHARCLDESVDRHRDWGTAIPWGERSSHGLFES